MININYINITKNILNEGEFRVKNKIEKEELLDSVSIRSSLDS